MKTVLVIFFLSVRSSYAKNTELPATDAAFDTIQFYSSNGHNWRIKTYATDEDVHIWSLGTDIADIVALARTNTERHYGDVLTEGYIVETNRGLEGIKTELAGKGLSTHLEQPQSGAVFWAPTGSNYRSMSVPS